MLGYLTTRQVALKYNRTRQAVSRWCRLGLFKGAHKLSERSTWLIPVESLEEFKPPTPGRVLSGTDGLDEEELRAELLELIS